MNFHEEAGSCNTTPIPYPFAFSGFTNRFESEYDPFGAGHSSTSISAILGMAVGSDFKVRCRVLDAEFWCRVC